jgi:hypothetical protein
MSRRCGLFFIDEHLYFILFTISILMNADSGIIMQIAPLRGSAVALLSTHSHVASFDSFERIHTLF